MNHIYLVPSRIKPNLQQHRIRWISRKCSVPIATAAVIDGLLFDGGRANG